MSSEAARCRRRQHEAYLAGLLGQGSGTVLLGSPVVVLAAAAEARAADAAPFLMLVECADPDTDVRPLATTVPP